MSKPIIFSIIESPTHPKLAYLYDELGYDEMKFTSVRRAINALKKYKPDVIVAQFFFSFSTNYASNHISNLDSLIITLQKYSSYKPKFIFLVSKKDYQYIDQLTSHYDEFSNSNHSLLLPVTEEQIRELL
ncbi:MAG: hypothetical protein KZQ83_08600 [gamma proteobacterium symbiont of Taylorina sp.]|nr:hypothetical protein [gamma proteobacterium symbiont of Taylorina sp.]